MGAIFKETYRGNGIYYHFATKMYGDETNPLYRTVALCKAAIDARIAESEANRPAHEKHWDTLSHDERQKWRRLSYSSELSASELAFQAVKGT